MSAVRTCMKIIYACLVILAGIFLLVYCFPGLDLDKIKEYLLLILLGILSQWLAVSFPLGRLSAGFAIVMFCMLIYGPEACAWTTALAVLIARGIANQNSPLQLTLFNAAQQVVAIMGATLLTALIPYISLSIPIKGLTPVSVMGMVSFVVLYLLINHGLVYIYALPNRKRHQAVSWWDILRWDSLTYLVTAPVGIVMALLYSHINLATAILLFVPLLVVQFILRMYVNMELANRELRVLYEISRRLGGKFEAAEIPGLLLKELRRAVPFHCGLVYLSTDVAGFFQIEAVYGHMANRFKVEQICAGQGFLGSVVSTGEAEIIYDSRADLRVRGEPGIPQLYRSMLLVPLVADGEVIGLLLLGEKKPMAYDESHLQTLSVIIGALTVALTTNVLEHRITYLETVDRQTGLLNRQSFMQECYHCLEEEKQNGAIVLLDIDYMAQYNRRYTYQAGDLLLYQVAQIVLSERPEGSFVGRYQGDQLALLLPNFDGNAAYQMADTLRQRIAVAHLHDRQIGDVRVSCGVAAQPENGKGIDRLLEIAEKSLNRAKRTGKNRVVRGAQL